MFEFLINVFMYFLIGGILGAVLLLIVKKFLRDLDLDWDDGELVIICVAIWCFWPFALTLCYLGVFVTLFLRTLERRN